MSSKQRTKEQHQISDSHVRTSGIHRPQLGRLLGVSILCLSPATLEAADWHSSWSAKNGGASDKTQQMLQADLIAKKDAGYYERIGENKNTYYVTNNSTDNSTNSTNDNRSGSFQETYSVGSLNASTSTVTIEGDGNAVNADNTANNDGAVNGSISAMPSAWDDLFQEVSLDAGDVSPESTSNETVITPRGLQAQ